MGPTDGGVQKMFTFKRRGGGQVLPCLEGGAAKVLDPQFSHFLAPTPLPLINDGSLSPSCTQHPGVR